MSKSSFISQKGILFFIFVFMILSVHPVSASNYDEKIKALRSQQDILNGEKAKLHEKLKKLRDQSWKLENAVNNLDDQYRALLEWRSSVARNYSKANKKFKQIDERIFKLKSTPMDFYRAKKAWESAGSKEQEKKYFRQMWKYYYGLYSEPSITDYQQMDLQVMRMDIDVRKRLVARVGEALVKIGPLVVKLVSLVAPGPKRLGAKLFVKFMELEGKMEEAMLSVIDVDDLGFAKKFFSRRNILQAKADKLASELNAIRDREEFGTEGGREAALKKAYEAREFAVLAVNDCKEMLQKVDALVKKAKKRLEEPKKRLTEINKSMVKLESRIQMIDAKIEALDTRILKLKVEKEKEWAKKYNWYASGIGLTVSGTRGRKHLLAADKLTAELLKMPYYSSFRLSGGFEYEYTEPCSYEIEAKKGKYKTITINVSNVGGYTLSDCTDRASLSQEGNGRVSLDTNQRKIYGKGPGKVKVWGTISPGFSKIISKKIKRRIRLKEKPVTVCWDRTIKGGPSLRSNAEEFEIYKVVDFAYLPSDAAQKKGKASQKKEIDLFIGEEGRGSSSVYRTYLDFFAYVSNGGAPYLYRPPGGHVGPKIINGSSDSFIITPDYEGKSLRIEGTGPGKVTIAPVVNFPGGKRVGRKGITITSNIVKGMVERPLNSDRDVPISGSVRYKVVVKGGADMSKYSAHWRLYSGPPKGIRFPRKSSFYRTRGGWATAVNVRFAGPPEDLLGKEFSLCCTIRKKGKEVYSLCLPESRILVKFSKMAFAFKGTDILVEWLDLFIPAPSTRLGTGLEVVCITPDDRKIRLPGKFFNIKKFGLPFISTISGTFELLMTNAPNGKYGDLYTFNMKSGFIDVSMDRFQAEKKGITFDGQRLGAKATVTLNKLHVFRKDRGRYILQVFGDANMTRGGYTARWHFRGGRTIESKFTKASGYYESSCSSSGTFDKVEILNAQGRAVGVYLSLFGSPLGEPKVRLIVPTSVSPGQKVVIYAEIDQMRVTDAFDCVMNWSCPPGLGRFEKNTTRVAPLSGNRARSANTLYVSRSGSVIGKSQEISVKLVRIVGESGKEGGF